ncbi:hypothetical protein GCM10011581_24580 [Saccharopolyspora subtropica]|uniref:Uncharacterized protein n=1 Tax=Saccharopolyspora thermophila TaxID=89367 RepID=A0A917JW38_9PSEU|nr:DUF5313 family protein [Saccharopolyspora subtropica]GGI86538.1 hypothetical protein GCM10011581_24580 [Saccharopolyspora subtropica]
MPGKRPNPVMWLYYQFGGTLPERHREWVLHDGTCRTWLLRVLLRGLLQIAPLAAVVFVGLGVFGGSWPIAAGALLLGLLVVARIVLTSAVDNVDARLVRHGYPPGHGSAVRRQRDAEAAERYRAVWRNSPDA